MLKTIDTYLNRLTMYRLVLYGLVLLLAIADGLAWAGVLSTGPVALLVSVGVLVAVSYGANELFGRLFRAPRNTESYLITALILACILPPVTSVERGLFVALTAVIAIASKYLLVWRGSHFLNPAAFAAFVVSVTGILPVTWWIANPSLLVPATLFALAVLRKQRKFGLFIAFGLAGGLMLLFVNAGLHGMEAGDVVKGGVESWPFIFMGSIMLTEPTTLPPTRYYQRLVAVLVGVLFACQLQFGPVAATPQFALLVGNLVTVLAVPTMGALLRLKRTSELAPNVYDLAFEPVGRRIAFVPGQYLEWTLPHAHVDSRGNRRMFSIASSPAESDIHLGTKTYEPSSSFKRALIALKPGDYIRVAHPAGSFTLPTETTRPIIFFAGGIGITPFRSMVQHLIDTEQTRDITLVYSARSDTEFVYRDVFDAAAANGLKTIYSTDQLDGAALTELLPNLQQSIVYISGPDAMVRSYKSIFRSLGVPLRNIKTDYFSGY